MTCVFATGFLFALVVSSVANKSTYDNATFAD